MLIGVSVGVKSPAAYQGNKSFIAKQIVDIVGLPSEKPFFELCCGSGAVSCAAVEAGHRPELITMVDLSPWGHFRRAIGDGSFDLRYFECLLNRVPADPSKVRGYLTELAAQPPDEHVAETFVLLQSGTYSGRPVTIAEGRWQIPGYRGYWIPKVGSRSRGTKHPMSPQPKSMLERVRVISARMKGVRGVCADVRKVSSSIGAAKVYIDPPYAGKSKYWYNVALSDVVGTCWASEARPLSNISMRLSVGRPDGGHSATRKGLPAEEWLSLVGWVDDLQD